MSIHIATLFLPHTASFDVAEQEDVAPSATPSPVTLKRNSSTLALASHMSSLNLFDAPSVSLTPPVDTEEALNTNPFNSDSRRNSRVQLSLPGNIRKVLTHGDADVPEWGSAMVQYNQPRSRAGPLPSKSVTDFRKLRREAVEDLSMARKKESPAEDPSSGSGSGKDSGDSSGTGEYDKWTIVPALRGNGALLNAIDAANSEGDLDITWVGTLGFPTDALPEGTKAQIEDKLGSDYNADVVYVTDQDFSGHYANFCKVVLWPLFHYQVPDDVNSKAYVDRSWEYYYNVNKAFADKLIDNYRKEDTIWVHDYHLLLVPSMVRAKKPEAKIGFFLHTAFPSSEIFRCQMKYKDLLKGMLGANLVAFQLQEYADHFISTCSRFLQIEANAEGIQLEDRFVNVVAQPIGINPKKIEEVRESGEFRDALKALQAKYAGKQVIVARDKLDRVHGVRQKFLAYERFLEQSPHRAEDTVLLQVLSPNHDPNTELSGKVSAIVSRISRKHGTLTRQPLEMYETDVSPAQYYAILTMGDALMISTQRDGMNLTAHEFIFCQDGKYAKGHGASILSEFAGCADVLKSDILRINPWNVRQQSEAISSVLNMDATTKQAHWAPLHKTVTELTGAYWYQELARILSESHKMQGDRAAGAVPRLQPSEVSKAYDQAATRVFILDYEGTLIARQTSIGSLLTSPGRIIDVINDLTMDPKNVVYVTSGMSQSQMSQIFQTANSVGLMAENGCFVSWHGERTTWASSVSASEMAEWKERLKPILSYYQERIARSMTEERACSLEFSFANVEDKKVVERQFGECLTQINGLCEELSIRAFRKDTETLVIEQVSNNKATMAQSIMDKLQKEYAAQGTAGPDFLMVAGNDREDECAFDWANELGQNGTVRDVFTISTGSRDTAAKAAMSKGCSGLLSLLEKLALSSLKSRPVKNPATKRGSRFLPPSMDQ